MVFPQVTHLALSGGGLCGLSYLGCIRFLQTEGLTDNIRHVCGTSIGAFFACAIALDIPYAELESLLKEHCKHPSLSFDACNIMNIFTTMGINDAEFLVLSLRKYILHTYKTSDITFLDLSKSTGKNLKICASCLQTASAKYFSVDDTPGVHVIEAVKASMTLPIFVKPTKIGDHSYVDGAVTDNHPVTCFGDPPPSSMLSIKVCAKPSVPQNIMTSFPDYVATIMSTYFSLVDKQYQKTKWSIVLNESPVAFMPIKCENNSLKISVSEDDIDNSIAYGYRKIQEWFTCMSVPCP